MPRSVTSSHSRLFGSPSDHRRPKELPLLEPKQELEEMVGLVAEIMMPVFWKKCPSPVTSQHAQELHGEQSRTLGPICSLAQVNASVVSHWSGKFPLSNISLCCWES
ncbi:unnamed protein product [Rangifer tarandus platyrhynchus]|uniref:Uncharacterized protein n=1 Tax=Rangifer tarandus platyrhynchus TaxID=3082113 RepID=A0ABN8XSP8_RANTA|nr:unnamed protein product [Rangifer tarandus platyrhynchus]